MRLVRFSLDKTAPATTPDTSPLVRYGVVENETVYETAAGWSSRTGSSWPLAEVRLLPPCWPTKIVCV
ncbi:MAG: DUF2437 domain-containing protein, partial [Bryobacteraceae bacterium]